MPPFQPKNPNSLYIEGRISFAVYKDMYRRGVEQRTAGLPCGCGECAAKATPTT